MPTPVDEESFAALVARFSTYLDELRLFMRRVLVQTVSGAGPLVLSETAHGGKSLLVSNGASGTSIPLTLPADSAPGVLFLIDQVGPAPVRLTLASGATLRHRLGHNGSAGQYASISVKCIRNVGGSAAEYLLAGDTAIVG